MCAERLPTRRFKDSEVNAVTSSGALANNESTYVPPASHLDDVVD